MATLDEANIRVASDVIDALPLALFVVGPDERVLQANRASVALCIRGLDQIPGRTLSDLLPTRRPGVWTGVIRRVFEEEARLGVEATLAAGGGRPLHLSGTAGPYAAGDRARPRAVLLLRDASEDRRRRLLDDAEWMSLCNAGIVDTVDDRLAPLLRHLESVVEQGSAATLHLVNEDASELGRLVSGSIGERLRDRLARGLVVADHGHPAARAVYRLRPVVVASIRRSSSWGHGRGAALAEGFKSCLAVPLVGPGNRCLGALSLYLRREGMPDEDLRACTRHMARTLAQLVERMRLQRELRQRRRVLQFTQEFNANLGREHLLAPVLKRIVEEARSLTGAEQVAIVHRLVDAGAGRDGSAYAVASDDPQAFASLGMPGDTPLQLATLRGHQTIRSADIGRETRFRRALALARNGARRQAIHSYLATPVVSRTGEVLGGLFLGHRERGVFSSLHEELASAIAAQAGIAIDNALHFESVRRRNKELAEEGRRKSRVLATLGHELRNPLGALTTSLALMEEANPMHPDVRRAMSIMWRQCRHMKRLVDDLLDMSRLARGAIDLHEETVSLQDVVADAVTDASFLTSAREQRVTKDFPDEPVWVVGDATRLEQVVANLVSNASRHSPDGGEIRIRVATSGDRAVIRVRDWGRGIDPTRLEEIFDLFVQAEDNTTAAGGGLGLGLTLVRELVRLHSGSVRATSQGIGHGSEFFVDLPRAPASPYAAQPYDEPTLAAESDGQNRPLERGRRVLLVEDQEDARDAMRLLLQRWGFAVHLAKDGPEAIARAVRCRPHVILLDIGLPTMSGWDVAKELRQRVDASVQIIALTGLGQAADRAMSESVGFDDHLVKPIDPLVLRARLEEAIETALAG